MKFRELHLGKAISAALFVLLLTVAGTKNALAQTQVATLQHGQEITAFYGASALQQAYEAATVDDGDIITLSSGTFAAVTINKAITLRGAGCAADTEAGTNPTVVSGEFSINLADTLVNTMNIEGILFPNTVKPMTLKYPTFTRCNFKRIDWGGYYNLMDGTQFVNCLIEEVSSFSRFTNTVMVNCVVWHPNDISTDRRVVAYNSIFGRFGSTIQGFTGYNCIIIRENGGNTPTSTCNFFNCIGVGLEELEPFGSGLVSNCETYTSYEEVFNTFAGEFTFEEEFLLTGTAQGFETTDGTQVGIYGGNMPYSNIPFYMVRKRTTVSNRSNVDGTLNVEIEIINEEEGE